MIEPEMINLDRLAAQHAQNIIRHAVDEKQDDKKDDKKKLASSIDNTVTKSLGVLQENGIYACVLYLFAKENENGKLVINEILGLLVGLKFEKMTTGNNYVDSVLTYINTQITTDLQRLLLARETLEQMLIYARYGAKARG
jgi:hypothetical protein